MIKLICFDFDGTLVDSKNIHFNSLNKAISSIDEKFKISNQENIDIYGDLTTLEKLNLLVKYKSFPAEKINEIYTLKKQNTKDEIDSCLNEDLNLKDNILLLKNNYKVCITSNTNKEFILFCLERLNIKDCFDAIYSNESVKNHKPNAEIYLRCMADFGLSPEETVIIEDSSHGKEAAAKSKAFVYGIDKPKDLDFKYLNLLINNINRNKIDIKWPGKSNINIVIPMAGAGSRFAKAGFTLPKPLINVNDKFMIDIASNYLNIDAQYIYIVQEDHYEKYNLNCLLKTIQPNCKIIKTNGLTSGAACSVLLAKEFIDNEKHLIIANSDQNIEWNSFNFMNNMISKNADGGIVTFEANDPKWSFVKLDNDNNYITEVAEKKVISNLATAGIYYYNKGSDFVHAAETMIKEDLRINNEFYVAPTYNIMIRNGLKILPYNCNKMWGLGTPEDLEIFLKNEKFR